MGSNTRKKEFRKDRLKYLMKQGIIIKNGEKKKVTQDDLRRWIHMESIDTIKGAFRDGKMLPEHLDRIAQKLNVQLGYIMGTTNFHVSHFEKLGTKTPNNLRLDPEGYVIPKYDENDFDSLLQSAKTDRSSALFMTWLKETQFKEHYSALLLLRYGTETNISGSEAMDIIMNNYDSVQFFIEDLLVRYINGLIPDPLYEDPQQ